LAATHDVCQRLRGFDRRWSKEGFLAITRYAFGRLEGGGGSKPQSQAFVVGEIFVFVTVLLDALQKFERLLFNNIRYID